MPSVKASWRRATKSFQTVDVGRAWLGYLRVACCCDGWAYVQLVAHSDKWVPALLVMSANVVTCRYSRQHCAPHSRALVACSS